MTSGGEQVGSHARTVLTLGLLLGGFAAPAAAQSLFVEGSIFAAVERRSTTETSEAELGTADLNGVVAGGGFSIGTFLTPKVSVRAQFAFASRVEYDAETVSTPDLGPTLPPGIFVPSIRRRVEASEKITTFSALVGYHTERRHKVQLAYLGGAAFFVGQRKFRYTTSYELPREVLAFSLVPADSVIEYSSTGYTVTAEVGLDADVALSSRWSLVPQARLMAYGGGLTLRPGVAFRGRW